jgi:repressor of nif and glnA expression
VDDEEASDLLRLARLAILPTLAEADRPLSAEEIATELGRRVLAASILRDTGERGH